MSTNQNQFESTRLPLRTSSSPLLFTQGFFSNETNIPSPILISIDRLNTNQNGQSSQLPLFIYPSNSQTTTLNFFGEPTHPYRNEKTNFYVCPVSLTLPLPVIKNEVLVGRRIFSQPNLSLSQNYIIPPHLPQFPVIFKPRTIKQSSHIGLRQSPNKSIDINQQIQSDISLIQSQNQLYGTNQIVGRSSPSVPNPFEVENMFLRDKSKRDDSMISSQQKEINSAQEKIRALEEEIKRLNRSHN